MVWSGAAKTHLCRIERVQHKFLIWLTQRARGADGSSGSDYRRLLHVFNVPSLEARRVQFDLIFLRNIFCCRIASSFLLSCFSLHVPSRTTRNSVLFHVPFGRISTVKAGSFCRLPMHANAFIRHSQTVDFFCDEFAAFRSSVLTYVKSL